MSVRRLKGPDGQRLVEPPGQKSYLLGGKGSVVSSPISSKLRAMIETI